MSDDKLWTGGCLCGSRRYQFRGVRMQDIAIAACANAQPAGHLPCSYKRAAAD